jgi:4-hydroxybenzoate polyprenyltransferase
MANWQRFNLKIDKWWVYKIAGGIFTWLLIIIHQKIDFSWPLLFSLAQILLLYFLLAISGHLMNDYFDIAYDAKARKRNLFGVEKKRWHLLVLMLLPFLALGLAVAIAKTKLLLYLVIAQLGISLIYAAPPIRLKERGWAAVFFTGFYERTIPYFMMFVWMNVWLDIPFYFVIYLVWAYVWECRNYLNGQLKDYGQDYQSNVRSMAIQLGVARTNFLIKAIFGVEISLLFVCVALALFSTRCFDILIGATLVLLILKLVWPLGEGKKAIAWIDEVYNKVFLVAASIAVLFVDVRYVGLFVLLHLLFFGLYWPYYHFLYYSVWHHFFLAFVYPKIRGVFAALVNYSIYYFRRYVLQWSEKRSRGIESEK